MHLTPTKFAEGLYSTIESHVQANHAARLAELVALCKGSKAHAAYCIVTYLSKPGRIPSSFGALLDLSQLDALARAFAVTYSGALRQAITWKQEEKLLRYPLSKFQAE